MNQFWKIVASFFYLGTAPVASGTFGTAGAVAIYFALGLSGLGDAAVAAVLLGMIVLFSALCIPATTWAEKASKKKDPSIVVLDEVVGYFVAVLFFPIDQWLPVGIAAFFLFRLFDIVKPPPARQLERLKGGYGVLLDDVAAGVYANVVLRAGVALFGLGWAG